MKSNMQAANMRRANRRIQFQERAIRQTEARAYDRSLYLSQKALIDSCLQFVRTRYCSKSMIFSPYRLDGFRRIKKYTIEYTRISGYTLAGLFW